MKSPVERLGAPAGPGWQLVERERTPYSISVMPPLRLTEPIHTVTFDCWSTLIYEAPGQRGSELRARNIAAAVGGDEARAAAAFAGAWRKHQEAWHRRVAFTGAHMLEHTLQALGVTLPAGAQTELLRRLEDDVLARDVRAIESARELLEALRRAGVRTALICDTGFSPGRVVRQLLARHGLLELLEVTIFSDEIGVPKPDARAFTGALSGLRTVAAGAIHVGDLRRSDVAGARAAGMGTVRFRGHHDDADGGKGARAGVLECAAAGCSPHCARPEADVVIDDYAELAELLDLSEFAR